MLLSQTFEPILTRISILVLSSVFALVNGAFDPSPAHAEGTSGPMHGIAMHGEPGLPADYQSFSYVNPNAPKGGRMAYAHVGTFDSLNPFIVQGTAPRGLWDGVWGNNLWDSLLVRNHDEPFSLYGLIAESVEVPEDRSWVEFQIHPDATFSDGEPLTVDDVVFSIDMLREKGRPNYRARYGKIASTERVGERGVRFTFNDEGDRELPLLIGLTPIFPKHATDPDTFDKSSLTPMIGSGPYRISEVKPGTSVTLERNPDYWAKDLPVKRGFDNFDTIRVEYFRDSNAYIEAFKKGLFDFQEENQPERWAEGYNFPAVTDGRIVLDEYETGTPKGMNGLVFNTRRPVFEDVRVREALGFFLDFEWLNRNLYRGLYDRTSSYFEGSELSAIGKPASDAEKALLVPYPDSVSESVLSGTYEPPISDGSGRDRANFRKGLDLLEAAGYERQGNKLVNKETGQPLSFEILVHTREDERLALAFQRALAVVGIDASVRLVDAAQYWERIKSFDFDMIRWHYTASLSPGTEQNFRWSSEAAENEGTFNFAAAADPAIDAMINALLSATNRVEFVSAVRAFDRVLVSAHYVLPLFHAPDRWIARQSKLKTPDATPLYGPQPTSWWVEDNSQ